MNEGLFRKGMVIAIIVCFIGVGVLMIVVGFGPIVNAQFVKVDRPREGFLYRGETTCCPLINSIEGNTTKSSIYGFYENYVISPDGEWINVTAKWLDIGIDCPTDDENPFDGYIDEMRISRIISADVNIPPCANFEWTPRYPYANKPIKFDASESYDPDGEIISFEWDFGDGNIGTGEQVTHNYSQPGIYEVVLTVTDNDGEQESQKKEITLENHRPTVEILDIKPLYYDYLVSEVVIITGSASDPDGNHALKEVTVIITDFLNPPKSLPVEGTTSWTCEWNTKEFYDRHWRIIAKSHDNGGLVSEPDVRGVWVDNSDPVPVITRPLNAIYVDDEVKSPRLVPFIFGPITFEVIPGDLPWGAKKIEYIINGELKYTDWNVSFLKSSTWKYSDIHFGPIMLQVNATDYVGHKGIAYKFMVMVNLF